MTIQAKTLIRKFTFNGVNLPDPGPNFSVDEVKDIYSNQYPDLATAIVNEPSISGDVATYTFTRNVGTKG
jgi:PRTRC genetic system protein C